MTSTTTSPSNVSVVIPTRNRPEMVLAAVNSVLNQSHTDLEVIVVIDGPDTATEAALASNSDPRLRVLPLPQNVGASTARNKGVDAARGRWIAFLDDDDEWFPDKLTKQVKQATESTFQYPVLSCQVIARMGTREEVWPRAIPARPLSEYLLARNSLTFGEGLMATITLFAPREVFDVCRFKPGTEPLEDWDWVLQCERMPGVGFEFLPEPLAIWNLPPNTMSLSRHSNWKASLRWAHGMRGQITPRAYAGFLAGTVARHAADQKDWRAVLRIMWDMMRNGAPKKIDFVLCFMRIVPRGLRTRCIALRKRGESPVGSSPSLATR